MRIHRLIHLLVRSIDGIRRQPWLHLLSLFTLAAAFLSFTATLTAAINLDNLLSQWVGTAELTVYLSDGTTKEELLRLSEAVSRLDGVEKTEPATPAEAQNRFASELGALGDMARSLPETAFPSSIDVHLGSSSSHNLAIRRALAARIEKVEIVKEVELYDDWFERLSAVTLVSRLAAWGLGFLALIVAILVVTAVVRSGVNARSREITVLGFIGATDRYVRFPFLLEGALETVASMLVALVSLHFLTNFTEELTGGLLPLVGGAPLLHLTPTTVLLLFLGSALTGLLGARISLNGLTSA